MQVDAKAMYEKFDGLLKKYGQRPADVARETGINKNVFTYWKNGQSIPKLGKLKKIADYFDVTVDFFLE